MADNRAEQYLILARSTKGAAAAKIILDATAAPGVYAFSELLDVPAIQAFQAHHRLLELFAYGTLQDYADSPSTFPAVSPAHIAKLKQLTLVSLALQSRSLTYPRLLSALQLDSSRALEDVIIDTIYAGLLGGKIHHHEQVLHVDWVAGRDVRQADLGPIKAGLDACLPQLTPRCANASSLLTALDAEIARTRQAAADDSAALRAYTAARDDAYAAAVANAEARVPSRLFEQAGGAHERGGIGARSGGPAGDGAARAGLRSAKGVGARIAGSFGRVNPARDEEHAADRGTKRPRD